MPGKIEIAQVKSGKFKGQFRFKLKADNGKNLSPNDSYHNVGDLFDTINKYFPNFDIVPKDDVSSEACKKRADNILKELTETQN